MPFFPLRNVIGLRGEGGESHMTRRKKSQQRAGGECSASARGGKVKTVCFSGFPHARARQVVFVFFLHLFTGRAQRAVYQSVRSEGFEENAFTCSVADFAVGEVGRMAREIRGKCWKKWDFSVAGWGESREGR